MQTYSEFQPTGFDLKGFGLDDRQHWFVLPVSRTRDSGILEESNFEQALEALGGESETVEVHRFRHWGPGWFELILIDPTDEERVREAEEIERALSDYPILSEDDYSQRQWNAIMETWENMSLDERMEFAVENGHSIFAARRDNPFDCNNDCGDAVYRLIEDY